MLIVCFVFLSSGACSGGAAADRPRADENSTLIAWALTPWVGDLNGMMRRRSIRVLTSANRTHYFLDGARERGFTYEYMKAFEKYIRKSEKKQINVIFIPTRRDQLLPWLIEGRGDIACANLTVTETRKKQVDFAAPIISDINEIVAYMGDIQPVDSLDDLSGRSVYVRESSSYYDSLKRLNQTFATNGRKPVRIHVVSEDLETEDILEMVNAGMLPITVIDNHLAEFWSQIFTNVTFRDDVPVNTGGSISCAIRKKNPELKERLSTFINKRKKGTEFGNIIHRRYLEDINYVKKALSAKEIRKFNSTAEIFKKYASKYDFDYLMIMAQGYQESGLDNSVKNPSGAVGILQVLPSTAAMPEINVRDIRKLENNVLAGTKYLRFLADRYFADEALSSTNRILFSFAAYNAGPTRIARLRRQAPRMGVDPNVWFRNVENLAARTIGQEPVQYVRNIFKYYVSYKLITERQEERSQIKGDLN
ncbi:MAG: lytic transglycosylase F [Hyphomicrobiales bacterium]|nr:lytic transglycosylase F [Hyphomicrobiales bacterium]